MSRKYKNPPLIEAVCEFQFDPESEWDIAVPGLVYAELKETFPIREQVTNEIEVTMTASSEEGIQPQIFAVADRIRFLREDKKALVQVGPHLLSINHLKPYPTWEEYLPLIQMAYGVYRDVAQPQGLARIGLRYINKIDIPVPRVNLEDYFQFYPHLGPELPQDISSFIAGVQFIYDGRDVLRVQMVSVRPDRPDCISTILDLEYSLLPSQQIELDGVPEWLQVAHDRIEMAFEACLTDKLRVIFEEESQ